MNSDAILVAKQGVDGVYDGDPKHNPQAKKYVSLPYDEVIKSDLKIMDQSAFILAREYKLSLHVFNFDKAGSMSQICEGEDIGILISGVARVEFEGPSDE